MWFCSAYLKSFAEECEDVNTLTLMSDKAHDSSNEIVHSFINNQQAKLVLLSSLYHLTCHKNNNPLLPPPSPPPPHNISLSVNVDNIMIDTIVVIIYEIMKNV